MNNKDLEKFLNGKRFIEQETDPVFRASPAAHIIPKDIKYLRLVPKIFEAIKNIKVIKGEKGDKGDPGKNGLDGRHGLDGFHGKTPVKGVDYFTPKEVNAIIEKAKPIKGVDYNDGVTPETNELVKEVVSKIKLPKDGVDGKDADEEGIISSVLDRIPKFTDLKLKKLIKPITELFIKKHEKDHKHDLIHDPFFLGTKKIDEKTIGNDKYIRYDEKNDKLVYDNVKEVAKKFSPYLSGGGTTLPSRVGQAGKYLTTDGDVLSWGTVVGGSGISRSINSISTPTTAGAAASTDYVYLISSGTTLTLPTAVGNTNLYIAKNVGASNATIAFTGGQTADGSATITLIQYASVDLVSDNSNWKVV